MTGLRNLTLEPFMLVFIGLVVAKLVVGGSGKGVVDFLIAGTFFVGGFGRPFAARRRWWLVGAGVLAIVVVGADDWIRLH